MEKDNQLKVILTAFVLLVLTIAFLSSIADTTSTVTEKTNVVDEEYNLSTSCYVSGQVNESAPGCVYTVTYAPTGWRSDDCTLTGVVITNNTGTVLVLDTDYSVVASTGAVSFLNTTSTNSTSLGNVAKVDYTYCGDSYVNSSWGRNILGVNVGLFAIAILVIIIASVYVLLGRRED